MLAYNWDCKNCPLYRVAGCPLFRGCLSIEVNGRTVGTFRIVRYIMGVHFSGVPLRWVPLYHYSTKLYRKILSLFLHFIGRTDAARDL